MMKNISTIVLALFTFIILNACGTDDDGPSIDDPLVGTWNVNNITYGGTATTTYPGIPAVTSSFTGESTQSDFQVTFNSDNTFTSGGSYTINLTYTFGGQTITQPTTISGEQVIGSGTWELNGDKIRTTVDGQASEGVFSELTANSFRLTTDLTQTMNANGATVTYNIDAVFEANR